ncbi:MAG: hypothetical protein IPH23_02545 [Gammaproteobacteria bacterium]|nr:hypothetical protein [Gammaproteobacteria bacterium]
MIRQPFHGADGEIDPAVFQSGAILLAREDEVDPQAARQFLFKAPAAVVKPAVDFLANWPWRLRKMSLDLRP